MLKGIDIAGYQSGSATIYKDWDFVIVKATEGRTYINPKMKAQAAAAVQNGQLLGFTITRGRRTTGQRRRRSSS